MAALYAQFLRPGPLPSTSARMSATASARFAGSARVVALEPQLCVRARHLIDLRRRRRCHAGGTRLRRAGDDDHAARHCGTRPSARRLPVSSPAAHGAAGWEGQSWDMKVARRAARRSTLDCRGVPDFAKIDVEGFEAEALAGLTRPAGAVLRIHHPARHHIAASSGSPRAAAIVSTSRSAKASDSRRLDRRGRNGRAGPAARSQFRRHLRATGLTCDFAAPVALAAAPVSESRRHDARGGASLYLFSIVWNDARRSVPICGLRSIADRASPIASIVDRFLWRGSRRRSL